MLGGDSDGFLFNNTKTNTNSGSFTTKGNYSFLFQLKMSTVTHLQWESMTTSIKYLSGLKKYAVISFPFLESG